MVCMWTDIHHHYFAQKRYVTMDFRYLAVDFRFSLLAEVIIHCRFELAPVMHELYLILVYLCMLS